jgi:hypothetical protein
MVNNVRWFERTSSSLETVERIHLRAVRLMHVQRALFEEGTIRGGRREPERSWSSSSMHPRQGRHPISGGREHDVPRDKDIKSEVAQMILLNACL